MAKDTTASETLKPSLATAQAEIRMGLPQLELTINPLNTVDANDRALYRVSWADPYDPGTQLHRDGNYSDTMRFLEVYLEHPRVVEANRASRVVFLETEIAEAMKVARDRAERLANLNGSTVDEIMTAALVNAQ
jgi:hypothetical protein